MIGEKVSNYEIKENLGGGGMGVVYLAEDIRLDREVAIKFLPPDYFGDRVAEKRFEREAKSAAALSHPHICIVHDVGEHEEQPYLVMERLRGQTLKHRLDEGPIELNEALKLATQIAAALQAAHAQGIIHRDIKPANIFITEEGYAKVLDFGLAKRLESGQEAEEDLSSALTRAGATLGTLAYMSPEQLRGQELDAATDIFSFGVVLYEMLTGVHPFRRESVTDTCNAIINDEPAPPTRYVNDVPEALEHILRRMMAKETGRRHGAMREVHNDLQQFVENSGHQRMVVGQKSRSQLPMVIVSTLMLTLLLILLVWWQFGGADSQVPVPLQITPLTFDGGWKDAPRLSPDGKKVAFIGQVGFNFDLYVKPIGLDTSVLRLTTHPAMEGPGGWSPDGERLAFVRTINDRATIYTIPWAGGQEKKIIDVEGLAQHPPAPNWSPNGRTLAYAERALDEEPFRIVLLDLETLKKIDFTSPPRGEGVIGDLFPSFSPDGSQIAFVRSPSVFGNFDIWVQDLEEVQGTPRQITFEQYESCYGIVWTPDGEEVLYTGMRTGQWVYRVRLDQGKPRQVPGLGENDQAVTLAEERLVFVKASQDPENIWSAPGRLSVDRQVPARPLIRSSRPEGNMAFSPDSKQIAFQSTRTGKPQVWIANRDGSNPYQLTEMETFAGTPRWAPDSRRIVFDSNDSGNTDIYVVELDSRRVQQLTNHTSNDFVPSFSRDGRWVYFVSNRGELEQVYKIPADGGEVAQVTQGGGNYGLESWDGQYLYYSKKAHSSGIWRVPVEGGEEVEVLADRISWNSWDLTPGGIYYYQSFWFGISANFRVQYLELATGETSEVFAEDGLFV
ncbi:MAG: PD40 domain-containing protein, partial [Acidobacteriota bacterium]